jgi:uncharacterized membrane protein
MAMDVFTRARITGLLMVVAAFGLGGYAGYLLAGRPPAGMVLTLTTSDAIPAELMQLGLSETQQQDVRRILREGRPRVMQVLEEMDPRMRAAVQATEREIEGVLQPDQLAKWKEFRRLNPPRTERRLIER